MSIFLVRATDGETGKVRGYWALDHNSGGYPYWGSINGAKQFPSAEAASKVLEDEDLTKKRKMVDGSGSKVKIYPPTMLHSAAGLCNAKMSGSAIIEIIELQEKVLSKVVLRAEIPA